METSDVTAGDMDKLRHMLGATEHRPKKNWGFRNYYASGRGTVPDMERLVAAGYCERGREYGEGGFCYHATIAGCAAAGLSKAATKRAFEP